MIDEQRLSEGLQRLLRDTEAAIRERICDEPSVEAQLKSRHAAAVQAGRTAGSAAGYSSFADDAITQAAAHWLLGCVFIRFLEDNGWLDERNKKTAWIAGPDDRLAIAKDQRTLFLRPDPELTDRDYLLHVLQKWQNSLALPDSSMPGTIRFTRSSLQPRVPRRFFSSSRRLTQIRMNWNTTLAIQVTTPGSWVTCIRTCPSLRASAMRSFRLQVLSSISFWTAP